MRQLSAHARTSRYTLGQLVREPHGEVGAIDAIFFDLEAAHDKSCTDADRWYAMQSRRPKTPKQGIWYSVILNDGAVLAGEDDLTPATS